MKEKARGLPGTSRAQQSIAALALSKDHYDTANGKDQTKKEATKDNQVPTTSPNKNLGPDLNISTLLIQNQTLCSTSNRGHCPLLCQLSTPAAWDTPV